MKKRCLSLLLLLSLLLSLTLTLVGCFDICYWEFEYGYEEITQIKIIDILNVDIESGQMNYIEIQEIDLSLAQQVYNDIISLEILIEIGKPKIPYPTGKSFLIVFQNGDYDIINDDLPKHYKYEDGEIIAYGISDSYDYGFISLDDVMYKYLNTESGMDELR